MNEDDMYSWSEVKREENLHNHDVDFMEAYGFDWDTAQTNPDFRYRYDEERFIAFGLINWKIYRMSYTYRGDKIRIINIRRAERQEEKNYVRYIKDHFGHR